MWSVLLVVLVTTVHGDNYENQCKPCPYYVHPEIAYCASDIVARVKINWNVTNPTENTETYGITVKHIEKLSKDFENKVTKDKLIIMEEQCYNFNSKHPGDKKGKTYLVAGRLWINEKGYPQIILNQCSYSVAVNDLNCYQRKGVFRYMYDVNCNCVSVNKYSAKFKCPEMTKSRSCYRDYAYCRNHGDHCGWQEFWKFRTCT